MEPILPQKKLKQTLILVLLLLLVSFANGYAQDASEGDYCPGPGAIGDEYATGIVFSQEITSSPSSTCQIGTVFAKVITQDQVLRLGMNIGNGGSALFRLYLDTDNNPTTGLTSDSFGGSLGVAGAEYILELNSNGSGFVLYSGNGSTKTPLAINNGLAAANGSSTGCNAGGGQFLEFNIPFGSIGINICDPNNPGLINLTKLASVSGNSPSSSRCIDVPLSFGIPLKGSVAPDANVCEGVNNTVLNVSGLTSNATVTKWQYSINGGSTWNDIPNTTTTYTAVNLTVTTKYRAVIKDNGLCLNTFNTSEATITVTPLPTDAEAGNNQAQCNNGNFTLSGNIPTIGTGTWTVVSGTANITSIHLATSGVTGVPAGTTAVLKWKIVNGTCSTEDTVSLTNDLAPTAASAGNNQTNCNNGSFTLAGNAASVGTGTWTVVSGTAIIANIHLATSGVTGVPAGTAAVLKWKIVNGTCSTEDDVVLTNDAAPIAVAGPNQTKCNTSTFTMAAVPSVGTGVWSFVGASGTAVITSPSLATTTVTSVPVNQNITLRWTETNGTCPSSTDDVIIKNDGAPIASAGGGSQTICSNSSATVSGATASNGTILWTENGAGTLSNATTLTPTYTAVAADEGKTVTLTMTVTSNNTCGSAKATSTYLIHVDPTLTISGTLNVCVNSTTQLSASATGAASDAWVSSNPSVATVSATGLVSGVSNGTAVITFTNATGCQKSATVTVNSLPVPPISGGNITECMAPSIQTLTATATAPAGQHVDWYTSATGGSPISSPTLNTVGTITYYAQAVNNITSCVSSTRTPVVLTINSCSLKITKDGTYQDTNADGITNIGDNVIYNFVVTNTSNVTMTNITVTDINAVVSGGPIASLAPGATDSTTFTAIHAITQSDIDSGIVYNWSKVTGTPPTGDDISSMSTDPTPCTTCPINPQCPDCTITPLTQTPKIALVKTNNIEVGPNGCAVLAVGDVVTYTFAVTNPGNVSLHNITVTDPHTGLSAIALQSGDSNNNNILEVTETWIYKATYTVTQADIDNGSITNQASVSGTAPNNATVSDQSGDSPTGDNPNVIPICTNAGIRLVKTNDIEVGPNGCSTLAVGDVVTYTFTVTNSGIVSLHNITVTDLHPGLSAIALQSGDSNNNNILEVTETWIYKATYTVTQADIDNGSITNQASVSGTAPNDTVVSDQSGDSPAGDNPNVITFCITPGLTVTKTTTTASFSAVGDVINYTINVKNTGNTTLHQITVKDPLTGLDTVIETLAPGASLDYTQSYTVTQEDLDKGSVINVAKADGLTPTNTPVSATDDETVNESAHPIDAVDDNAGTIVGVNQITPNVINVFTNDTLNAAAVNPADVILTTVTPNPFLQLNPDGSIDVLADAPVGPQTLVYQICEKLNNTNCDSATVTVNIEAPSMTISGEGICINDVPYFSYTATANNFTPVNGLTLTWTDSKNNVVSTMTNLPLSGKVLWPGATVDQNGNGTDWPGWVLEGQKWIEAPDGFENTRPTASVTFTLNPSETIVVNYPPSDPLCTARPTFLIDAVDDTASTVDGLHGVKNILNVFNNDTLNTVAVNPADVTLSILVPDPNGAITLNPDGSVDVKENAPSGTYTLTYQICEIADAGNCDSALVTITVVNTPLVIQATNDTFSVTQCSVLEGVRNALSNDLLNGVVANPADFKFKLLTALGQFITIDEQGNITIANNVAAGQYVFDYQICEAANPNNCSTATITINVAGIESVTITIPSDRSPCNADTTPVDLFTFLPEGTPRDGVWVDSDHTGAVNGNILNAFGLPISTYHFEYKIAGDCPRSIFLVLNINDDCKVLPCKSLVIHNAFTSNEDGRNDYFQIDNLDDNDCYKNIRLEVFNRWGVLVFEKDNYNNGSNAFRGYSEGRTTINKREGLPTGTYFYILSYDTSDGLGKPQSVKKDGYLYLIK
ncbi:DUF7507 domain-containing protein [Flavobacterium aestivum]|uniref:DUF7507 domain-containing protein n=1 Tax=Flavobacterium aestivum TaxID=3003257 RepID=UPI002482BA5E|nr:gliding motility-associated C-terminal domain-containing protein [Flavobacterium aestivum]